MEDRAPPHRNRFAPRNEVRAKARAARMNIELSPQQEAYIRRKLATGRYCDPGEVVRDALRMMQEREGEGRAPPSKSDVVALLKSLEHDLRQRGIVSVSLFGSIVHDAAQRGSDVDVLIDADPASNFDLIDLVAIKNLLSDRLGHDVDVVERRSLRPMLRDRIQGEAETVFS